MSLRDVDVELEQLRAAAPQGLSALAMPALNAVNLRHGHEPARRLTFTERLAHFAA